MAKQKPARRPDVPDQEGTALQRQGKHREAIPFHERAIAIDPSYVPAHHNLGNALLGIRDFEGARASFARALQLAPALAESHNGLGAALHGLRDVDGAIDAFRAALELKQQYGEAANNLGITLRERGDIDDARVWMERSVEFEPDNGRFMRHLVDTDTATEDAPYLSRLRELYVKANAGMLSPDSRIEAQFAYGKVMSDLGRVDEAFIALDAANLAKRERTQYNEELTLKGFEQLAHTFNAQLLDVVRGCGEPSTRPIFIIGMPRSGTTLLETMLAAHPDVTGGGELATMELSIGQMPPITGASTIAELRQAVHDAGARYLAETAPLAAGAPRMTDKMPFNFRFAPFIHAALPGAKILHISRNPLDVAYSCYTTYFVDNVPFSYNLAELGRYYRGYVKLMNAWRAVIPPEAMLEVTYEELVGDFEAQARRVLAFLGLPWNADVLEFHRFRHHVRSASQSQVRRPLYRSSVGRAHAARAHLRSFLDALGEF